MREFEETLASRRKNNGYFYISSKLLSSFNFNLNDSRRRMTDYRQEMGKGDGRKNITDGKTYLKENRGKLI